MTIQSGRAGFAALCASGVVRVARSVLSGDHASSNASDESDGHAPCGCVGMRRSLATLVLCGCSSQGPIPPYVEEVPLAHPPTRPDTAASSGDTRWFVVDRLFLGVTKRDGIADTHAWKDYGYDLDARATSRDDSKGNIGECIRRVGTYPTWLADGNHGIDNNVGQHVMSVFRSIKADIEEETNARIAGGRYTIVLRLENVGPDDNAKVPGALWLVGEREPTSFAPTEGWPVAGPNMLPLQLFPDGYMRGGVWVSTDARDARALVPVPVMGDPLIFPLHRAVLTVRVSDGAEGVIAGAIRTTDLESALEPSLTRRGTCSGATYDQIMSTISESADLLADAGGEPRPCDAVSAGIGFTMKPIAGLEGTAGAPLPAIPDCDRF